MRPLSKRKHVPTRSDAHAFVSGKGHWEVGKAQYLTDKDRVVEVERVRDELYSAAKTFPRTRVLEYAILKAHLIAESAVTHFVRLTSPVLVPIEELRFSSGQRLQLAILHGFGYGDPTMIPSLEILNSLRNQVAHRFDFDRTLVDELVRLNSEEYDPSRDANDTNRIRCLRSFVQFVAGSTAGALEAIISMTQRKQPDVT